MSSPRPLFGGAITMEIPNEFRDVSTMRQVPDNQECFSLPELDAYPNVPGPCIIVELLEYQKDVANEAAAAYYFKDLAEANGVASDNMTFTAQPLSTTPSFPNLSFFSSGIGMQNVSPGRDVDVGGNPRPSNPVWIKVEIGVMRLESVGTDMLISLSVPTSKNGTEVPGFSETFHRAVNTLSIQNWGLFGYAS